MTRLVGTTIERATAGPIGGGLSAGANQFLFTLAERGPVNRVVTVSSFDEYRRRFGQSYVDADGSRVFPLGYHCAKQCFTHRKQSIRVVRIAAPDAETGGAEVLNVNEETLLTITAKGPGPWSQDVDVEFLEGARGWTVVVRYLGRVVETFRGVDFQDSTTIRTLNGASVYIDLEVIPPESTPAVNGSATLAVFGSALATLIADFQPGEALEGETATYSGSVEFTPQGNLTGPAVDLAFNVTINAASSVSGLLNAILTDLQTSATSAGSAYGFASAIAGGVLTLTASADLQFQDEELTRTDGANPPQTLDAADFFQTSKAAYVPGVPASWTPSLEGPVSLSAGTNGGSLDAADIIGEAVGGDRSGLFCMTRSHGWGVVHAPDFEGIETVVNALVERAAEVYRMVYFYPLALSYTDVESAFPGNPTGGFNVGVGFPAAIAIERDTDRGLTIPGLASPAGEVCSKWLNETDRRGAGKAPAGRGFDVSSTLLTNPTNGAALIQESAEADYLTERGINPVWRRNENAAVNVGSARTFDTSGEWLFLHHGFLWCKVADYVDTVLDSLLHEIAEPSFYDSVRETIRGTLASWNAGTGGQSAIFSGVTPPPGRPDADAQTERYAFQVDCGEHLQTPEEAAQGIVVVELWFRPANTAERFPVRIAKQTV
jgi:hypothetical protein